MAAAGSLVVIRGRCFPWIAFRSEVPAGLQQQPEGASVQSILVER